MSVLKVGTFLTALARTSNGVFGYSGGYLDHERTSAYEEAVEIFEAAGWTQSQPQYGSDVWTNAGKLVLAGSPPLLDPDLLAKLEERSLPALNDVVQQAQSNFRMGLWVRSDWSQIGPDYVESLISAGLVSYSGGRWEWTDAGRAELHLVRD